MIIIQIKNCCKHLVFPWKVWDRRVLDESCPCPVGVLAGHADGITHVDPRVMKKIMKFECCTRS